MAVVLVAMLVAILAPRTRLRPPVPRQGLPLGQSKPGPLLPGDMVRYVQIRNS
jgi:hypothetical protein